MWAASVIADREEKIGEETDCCGILEVREGGVSNSRGAEE